MSSPEPIHSPPSQSLQHDQLTKAPSKECPSLQHSAFMEIPVRPLHLQKRAPAPKYGGTRGPRPLPPCPTNAKVQSMHGKEILPAQDDHGQNNLSPAPPPFTPVGPSLDGPPYEGVGVTPFMTSSLSDPFSNRGRHQSQLSFSLMDPRNQPPLRRSGYSALQGVVGEAEVQSRTQGARLAFDPSVAYNDHQYGNASGLGHAVSSHIQRAAANSGSRFPHIRSSDRSLRPSSSSLDSRACSTAGPISSQTTPTLPTSPSPSTHSLNHPPPTTVNRSRWAASEYDIATHIYRD
ncbi:hypothetical protein EDC04DRAFT_2622002 [Pisolithus marmoratus]|nr:hypothetical protein EDC04DRAFT_2622002 [Pisolithus marmoratus]